MAIRYKNLDLETNSLKFRVFNEFVALSANDTHLVFAAPVDCEVLAFKLYARNSSTALSLKLEKTADSAVLAAPAAAIFAGKAAVSVAVSSNKFISAGTILQVVISCTESLGSCLSEVQWKPRLGAR